MTHLKILTPIAAALMLATVVSVSVADENQRMTTSRIEPVSLLQDGAIAACGLRMDGRHDDLYAIITLTLIADRNRPMGTRMMLAGAVKVGADSSTEVTRAVTALRFKTASVDVASRGSSLIRREDGHYEAAVELNALDGAQVFRETLLSGAVATFEVPEHGALDLQISGPAAHSVRAAYLNCAGDLLRPEAAPAGQRCPPAACCCNNRPPLVSPSQQGVAYG